MCTPYPFFKKTVMGPWMACPLFCIGDQLHKKQTTKYTKHTKKSKRSWRFYFSVFGVFTSWMSLYCRLGRGSVPGVGDWGGAASPLP